MTKGVVLLGGEMHLVQQKNAFGIGMEGLTTADIRDISYTQKRVRAYKDISIER